MIRRPNLYLRWGKRACDIAMLIMGMAWWFPLMGLLALAVRLINGRPVLFRQPRPGYGGKTFTLLKFRTMSEQRGQDGQYLPDGQRLTRFGHFLRSTSLDELPALLNVLWGEMSIVGPRPLLVQYLARYTPEQARRHEVRPGITGWAQVNGRNALSWEEKFKLDVWYVDHVSFWLDVKILWMTLWKVLKREGISAEGHATMPEFLGPASGVEGACDEKG